MKRHTRPTLGLPTGIEIDNWTRTAVEATLHANETETVVTVGRGWCKGFIVIARDVSPMTDWAAKVEAAYIATTSLLSLLNTPGLL